MFKLTQCLCYSKHFKPYILFESQDSAGQMLSSRLCCFLCDLGEAVYPFCASVSS